MNLFGSNNQITSLEHCPKTLTELDCSYNQLSTLEHCIYPLKYFSCDNNPFVFPWNCKNPYEIVKFLHENKLGKF